MISAIAISAMFFSLFIICWAVYPYRDVLEQELIVRMVVYVILTFLVIMIVILINGVFKYPSWCSILIITGIPAGLLAGRLSEKKNQK